MFDELKIIVTGNKRPLSDFEDYSSEEMHSMLYQPFSSDCPVQILNPSDEHYAKIPMFMLIRHLMKLIADNGEMKLTARGYLPVKVVKDMYSQKYLTDSFIERGWSKVYQELEIEFVHLAHILIVASRLAKKRHGKLSLTKVGEKLLKDNYGLLKKVITTHTLRFNWAYLDAYGENGIGQIGVCFSLILIDKYSEKFRDADFYAEKYFTAYPHLITDISLCSCYSVRTFRRFMEYFGIVEVQESYDWTSNSQIKKTELFNKIIGIEPPKYNK